MIPQVEAFEAVVALAKGETGVDIKLSTQLPANSSGTTAELTGGMPKGRYLNKQHGKETVTVLFLSKDESQKTALENVCAIGNCIDTVTNIFGQTVNVLSAGKQGGPAYVGYDGKFYVYSLITEIFISF
jgi:hypothetical protein